MPLMDKSILNHPPSMLRKLADDIEAGEYGAVECVAAVVNGTELAVFGSGPKSGVTDVIRLVKSAYDWLVDQYD